MNTPLRKKLTRLRGHEFCRLELELRTCDDGELELSVCGSAGHLETKAALIDQAIDLYEDYFSSDEGMDAVRRAGRRSPRAMAKATVHEEDSWQSDVIDSVIVVGGPGSKRNVKRELHLKVHSCGQIRTELNDFFPDHKHHFHWHLNRFDTPKRVLPPSVIAWFHALPEDGEGQFTRLPDPEAQDAAVAS